MTAEDKEKIVYIKSRVPASLHREFKKAAVDAGKPMEEITAQLIEEWLTHRGIENAPDLKAIDLLKLLLVERKPTDGEIAEVAHSEGLSPEALYKLRDRLFPEHQNKKKTNGASTR